ncbi:hypothetical protein M407DRAFT_18820 [Tulasnella calospora MUT 4182]|uniref:Phospholipid/glycerol acyltransferase domain-containing protein n=1 Tax=Tulasnella calospora MUT 4182 TaxID=1051891 RepID=A0A0C3LE90_9AGAM|nr:hypothetical protein M407DRAFT_18820 [Tulasnella calospora MUT 4182]
MPFGPSHKIILSIAKGALHSFFHEIRVINEDNVPKDGPVLVLCTHHNMIIDPAMLSSTFPHGRFIHYWAKASLFANPIAKAILVDAGNIPVNRRSKDNQSMFKGTFDALAADEVVALFPEGTSYTEPRIMQVKDGASWAALEYTKWATSEEGKRKNAQPLRLIPAGLVYTNKSKYRSSAIMEYGKPIPLESLAAQFNAGDPDAAKQAVKKLTKTIEATMVRLTINANDWDALYAGRMARQLLWEDERTLNLDEFVAVSQILVDLFNYQNTLKSYSGLKEALLKYYALLKASKLTNDAICTLPLPRTLDPSRPTPLPSRLSTLGFLLLSTFGCIGPLPFFTLPLLINAPVYIMSRYGANLAFDEEESQAQNKVVFGALLTTVVYGSVFCALWAFFWMSPLGAVLAGSAVWLLFNYYLRTIDDFYTRTKRLFAAWRVLVGVWGPRGWDLSPADLKQYTVPEIPKINPWVERPLTPTPPAGAAATNTTTPASESVTEKAKKHLKKPASRSLVRHVLRARIEASRALEAFLQELEVASPRVRVSAHLGREEGTIEEGYVSGLSSETGDYLDVGAAVGSKSASTPGTPITPGTPVAEKRAYLEGREIIKFLRDRGAKIAHQAGASDWVAALSSDEGESETPGARGSGAGEAEVFWVKPSAQ